MTELLPCCHCGCEDIRHDHPTRAPRVYCSQCRATAQSPLAWNSRPADWDKLGGVNLAAVAARLAAWNTRTQLTPESLPTWDHYAEEHVDLPSDNGPDDIDFNPDEELIGKIARALASADGLIFDEVCGYDDPNGLDECDSSTCVSALYEDHDAEWARSVYWRTALNWIYPLILSERATAHAAGRAEERAEVAAWLRRAENAYVGTYDLPSAEPSTFRGTCLGIADAIERGHHTGDKGDE